MKNLKITMKFIKGKMHPTQQSTVPVEYFLPGLFHMNLKNSLHRPLLLLFLLGNLMVGQLMAQSTLSTSDIPTRINYENGTDYTDYFVPNVGGSISFTLNGGDGGRRRVPDLCTRKGGQGATVQATFFIGPGSGQLAPGGRLRFIPGERGESQAGNGAYGAGGGGGSGLLYTTATNISGLSQTPSLDFADAGTSWVILVVAGGGGGAGLNGVCDGTAGGGGVTTEDGGDGSPNGGDGGTDGNGGDRYGGGGYRVNGQTDNNSPGQSP
ncbi:MAG: hypothetical protein KDC85_15360, partial [Saprospiraceae bacterium]|nr:hypothetical protein [Saprospiraceae bacterium]